MGSSPARVAILDDYQNVGLTTADWSSLKDRVSIDVFHDTLHDEDALVERLHSYPIICAMRERTKFPASLLSRLTNLKLIATTGMGNRGIDIEAAQEKGIVVCGTYGRGDSTIEQIWALILSAVRYIVVEDANVKRGNERWQTVVPVGLNGKTLGLLGAGRLGSQTAAIAKAFKMNVLAWSPHLTPERAAAAGAELAESKADLFKRSDVLSIHMVLSPETHHLVTAEDLAAMKPTSFFVNTSRGPIVDESALVNILQDRKIAGAALDVYEVEPLPLDHPLRTLDNVTLSPHNAYVCDTSYETFWTETVENIEAFLDGHPTRIMQPAK